MKTKDIKNLIDFFESEKFVVHYDKESDDMSIETWTNREVNMFVNFNELKSKSMDDIEKDFDDYVEDFDVGDEIDLHRQMRDYKKIFTIRWSVEDFEAYETRLEETLERFRENNKRLELLNIRGVKALKANILNGRFKAISNRWYHDIFIKNVEELVWGRNMVDGYNVDFITEGDYYTLHFDGNLGKFEIS